MRRVAHKRCFAGIVAAALVATGGTGEAIARQRSAGLEKTFNIAADCRPKGQLYYDNVEHCIVSNDTDPDRAAYFATLSVPSGMIGDYPNILAEFTTDARFYGIVASGAVLPVYGTIVAPEIYAVIVSKDAATVRRDIRKAIGVSLPIHKAGGPRTLPGVAVLVPQGANRTVIECVGEDN